MEEKLRGAAVENEQFKVHVFLSYRRDDIMLSLTNQRLFIGHTC